MDSSAPQSSTAALYPSAASTGTSAVNQENAFHGSGRNRPVDKEEFANAERKIFANHSLQGLRKAALAAVAMVKLRAGAKDLESLDKAELIALVKKLVRQALRLCHAFCLESPKLLPCSVRRELLRIPTHRTLL